MAVDASAEQDRVAAGAVVLPASFGTRGKWLNGSVSQAQASEKDGAVPVKAKPQSRPQNVGSTTDDASDIDPWKGQQLKPAASDSPDTGSSAKGGASWDAFFRARPQPQDAKMAEADSNGSGGRPLPSATRSARPERQAGPQHSNHFSFGGGRGFRGGGGIPADVPADERISHCLGRTLRYRTDEYRLDMDEDGFVAVPALLALPEMRGATAEDVCRVVEESFGSRGKRFEIRETETEDGQALLEVRALYRHPQDSRPPPRYFGGRGRRFFDDGPDWGRRGDGYGYNRGPSARGGAPRKGFSQAPPLDENDAGQEVSSASKPSPSHFKMSPRGNAKDRAEHYDIEDEFAALSRQAQGSGAESKQPADSCDASASTAASSAEADGKEEVWERYLEPGTLKVWFWNPATDEVLWADDPDPSWQEFYTESGQRWWWQESTGRYFFEDLETAS